MSKRKLKVLITSGGTISKIDDIRNIGNFSGGTTGALIAEEFLRKGAEVYYIHSKQAKKPFRKNPNYNGSLNKEMDKIKLNLKEFSKYQKYLQEFPIETFEEYYNILKKIVKEEQIDVAVLAAAVSDYGVRKQKGKISSEKDSLVIKLEKNPKVISLIKKWNPKVFQVGFKLLSNSSVENLIDVAYRSGIKVHSNLTIANTISNENFKDRKTFIITPEKSITPVSVKKLPSRLVETVFQRFSRRHYKTILNKSDRFLDLFKEDVQKFREYTQKFYQLNLFEPYFNESKSQFGFVAFRLPKGFLITSRGSNKNKISDEDIVYVRKVDFDKRTISIDSLGKKASLNAIVAAKIFEDRVDTNLILHSHIYLDLENKTKVDYAPGTQEDIDEVTKHLTGKRNEVELDNHGVIILGKDFDGILKKINIEPAYSKFSKYYDLIYKRFQKSKDFILLIKKEVERNKKILDLAAGTGEVSKQLIEMGYKNLMMADKSEKMLEQAKSKLGNIRVFKTTFENLDLKESFDAVVLRQAINYISNYQDLVLFFRKVKSGLNDNGKIIFNAPNFNEQAGYPDKFYQYDYESMSVKVNEKNLIEGKSIIHAQRAEIIQKDGKFIKKIYDINKFQLFTKEEFNNALMEAGFKKIFFFGKGLKDFTDESKSLYCVAS